MSELLMRSYTREWQGCKELIERFFPLRRSHTRALHVYPNVRYSLHQSVKGGNAVQIFQLPEVIFNQVTTRRKIFTPSPLFVFHRNFETAWKALKGIADGKPGANKKLQKIVPSFILVNRGCTIHSNEYALYSLRCNKNDDWIFVFATLYYCTMPQERFSVLCNMFLNKT